MERNRLRSALLSFWERSSETLALHCVYREPNALPLLGKALALGAPFMQSHRMSGHSREANGAEPGCTTSRGASRLPQVIYPDFHSTH